MPIKAETVDQSNSTTSIFSKLSEEHKQQLNAQTASLSIKAGQTLIEEGDKADSLFFLTQGKLVVFSDDKPIAEILPGESVGEIAFLMGGVRTATVVASRNSKLLELNKKTYDKLTKDIPEITQSIIHSLANRLNAKNISSPTLEPKVSKIVALLPAGKSEIPNAFIKNLLNNKNEISKSWKILHATELNSTEELDQWIEENEEQASQLILIGSGSGENPELLLAMSEHADKSFMILDNKNKDFLPASKLENNIYKNSLLNNIDLVILRENNSIEITGTAKLLIERPVHLHHHIAIDHQPDLERLQRFIAGKATGLVLCGGGAFGSAHLGMIKALQEQGYHFDILGGTSVGSAITGLSALGYTPDKALTQLEEMFITKKVFKKYTAPLYSFIDHKYFDHELRKAAKNIAIEDLPINYFAVATNLSLNQLQVIRKGPLWKAVRASCSIPGILPPYLTKNGEVLIDGAVMDNTPIKTLRSMKSGPNVVMNFTPMKAWKVNSRYDDIPRGFALLRKIFLPKSTSSKYFPTIFAILSRTMVTNTEKRFSEIDQKDDIFLEPKRLPRMGMMNWKKSQEQFDLSYKQMKTALKNIDTSQDKIDALRKVSISMKQRGKHSN